MADENNYLHPANDVIDQAPEQAHEICANQRSRTLESYLDSRDKGFYIFMDNDAMVEAGIHQDDLVVANADQELKSGALVVAIANGQTLVRRYFKNAEGEFLAPENVCYPTIEVTKENCNICGVVTKIIHSF